MNTPAPDVRPPEPPPRPQRRWRRAAGWWLVFLVACTAFAAAAGGLERQRREAVRAWADSRNRQNEIRRMFWWRGLTARAVERRFNGGRPLERQEMGRRRFVSTLPGETLGRRYAGWNVRLVFHEVTGPGGAVVAADGRPDGQVDLVRIVPPREYSTEPSGAWVAVQRVRRVVVAAAGVAWAAGLVLACFAGPYRRAIAQACLGAAVAGTLAWVLAPSFRWERWFANIGLWTGASTIALSLLLLALPARRRRTDLSHCHACRYDLTGNESGVCPECGTPTLAAIRQQHRQELERYARAITDEPAIEGATDDDDDEQGAKSHRGTEGTEAALTSGHLIPNDAEHRTA